MERKIGKIGNKSEWEQMCASLQHCCSAHQGKQRRANALLVSAAKLAALSWDPENLKKLSLNAYLQIFATKMPYLQIFATKMPYLQVFATKIALLNYKTKTQCLALILSVQDKINQLIANLFY